MKMTNIVCLECSKEKEIRLSEKIRGNGKYCSRSCSAKSRNRNKELKLNCKCSNCNKKFHKNESSKKNSKSGLFFCSRKCKDIAQRIGGIKEIQPDHYNNGKYNYRDKAYRNFEKKCNRCDYQKFIAILEVHHKDKDRNNNKLSNLEILCPNCHKIEHLN